jgi:hypothetical protein
MVVNPSTEACVSNSNTNLSFSGNFSLIHATAPALPNIVFYCNFTAASVNGTSCDRGDGFGGNMASYVQPGDILWGDPVFAGNANVAYPFAYGSTVATVTNGTPATMTLSVAATQTGRFPVLSLPAVH